MSITVRGITLDKPLAKYIDHTLLKPEATEEQIKTLCAEALDYGFASVCVNTCYVPVVAEALRGSEVLTCCVIGFPLGAMSTEAKAFETRSAIASGAQEVDMVINIGALKGGNTALVKDDIAAVAEGAGDKAIVKVIIETCLLTYEEKVVACELAKAAGAHFVKTSTGFSTGGATETDIALMRKTVGPNIGVKASGGVRGLDAVLCMIQAGASRVGTSAGGAIIEEANA